MNDQGKIYFLLLHLGQGGVEQFAANLANEFCKKVDVEIISVYKKSDVPVPKLDGKIKVRYVFDFDIAERKKDLKFLAWMAWHYLTRRVAIGWHVRQIKKGTILSTRAAHNDIVGKYAAKGVKKIATEHNHLLDDKKYTEAVIRSCRCMDYVILPSQEVFEYYRKRVENAKCVRIPHFLKNMPSSRAKLDNLNVISLGRLSPEKGYDDLIRVFRKVADGCLGAKLTILGDGGERGRLQDLVGEYSLQEIVSMPGHQDNSGVEKELLTSSVFVSASHTEAFGLAALEAMACGLPVVIFESARGILDFVEDGKDGIVVKNRDRKVMAAKILEILGKKRLRQLLGDNARKKAAEYSADKIMPMWWRVVGGDVL